MDTITTEVTIQNTKSERDNYTVFGVAEQIIAMAPELNEHKKHIEALIKRLIHSEKYSVYSRITHLAPECPHNKTLLLYLQGKVETHAFLAGASDDNVVTW